MIAVIKGGNLTPFGRSVLRWMHTGRWPAHLSPEDVQAEQMALRAAGYLTFGKMRLTAKAVRRLERPHPRDPIGSAAKRNAGMLPKVSEVSS